MRSHFSERGIKAHMNGAAPARDVRERIKMLWVDNIGHGVSDEDLVPKLRQSQ